MFVINYKKIFYSVSIVLVLASLFFIFKNGLVYGIDFTGGSIIEISYQSRPEKNIVEENLKNFELGHTIQESGSNSFIIRMKNTDDKTQEEIKRVLGVGSEGVDLKRFDSIGPSLGQAALRSSILSIVLVLFGIVLFVAYAFRKVSKPVSSWKYGFIAIICLAHDVIIPSGVFAMLGYEVDTLFVTALLVVLGFSVHDTIVVFDRVRENLKDFGNRDSFVKIVANSISQTFTRSINTSLTTLLALVALYFYGGEVIHHFSLALIIGIIAGTYSSIFIGSPLLVTLERMGKKS